MKSFGFFISAMNSTKSWTPAYAKTPAARSKRTVRNSGHASLTEQSVDATNKAIRGDPNGVCNSGVYAVLVGFDACAANAIGSTASRSQGCDGVIGGRIGDEAHGQYDCEHIEPHSKVGDLAAKV